MLKSEVDVIRVVKVMIKDRAGDVLHKELTDEQINKIVGHIRTNLGVKYLTDVDDCRIWEAVKEYFN